MLEAIRRDVTAAMDEQAIGKEITFNILDSEAMNDFS